MLFFQFRPGKIFRLIPSLSHVVGSFISQTKEMCVQTWIGLEQPVRRAGTPWGHPHEKRLLGKRVPLDTPWDLSFGDRRGTLGTIHSPRAGSGKSSSIFGLQVVTEGPCSASMGMSCQESGNSHKKGISAWMGKEQRKTSWQQVGGTATTQPPAAPCLPAARSCQHTGSRDLTAHYPQQQIFPKGEQLR